MQNLNWEPLEERRAKNKVTLFYKARQNLIDVSISHLKVNTRHNRKGESNYALPISNVDCHLYSYYPSTIRMWNTLPAEMKECNDLIKFKEGVNTITLTSSYK